MTQIERESMEVDVLYVGAGPATLASAIHLMNQVQAWNRDAEKAGKVADRAADRARAREERVASATTCSRAGS